MNCEKVPTHREIGASGCMCIAHLLEANGVCLRFTIFSQIEFRVQGFSEGAVTALSEQRHSRMQFHASGKHGLNRMGEGEEEEEEKAEEKEGGGGGGGGGGREGRGGGGGRGGRGGGGMRRRRRRAEGGKERGKKEITHLSRDDTPLGKEVRHPHSKHGNAFSVDSGLLNSLSLKILLSPPRQSCITKKESSEYHRHNL